MRSGSLAGCRASPPPLLLVLLLTGAALLLVGVEGYAVPWQLLNKRDKEPPHSKDPEISVCDKQLKRGDQCGSRPLCCQASTCQMYNSFYRTFMDCPHGVKHKDCVCIEESLASRTDFSEWLQ